jgi:hypothetical protein
MDSHVTEHPVVGHEENTVQLKPVILFAIILVLVSAFSFAGVWFMLDFLEKNQAKHDTQLSPLADPNPLPPAPRLQVSSGQDLKHTRQTEDAILSTYHWVDKEAGVVGMPVEQAIKLLAERGLPTRSNGAKE